MNNHQVRFIIATALCFFFVATSAIAQQTRQRPVGPPRRPMPPAAQGSSAASIDNLTLRTKTSFGDQTSETTLFYKGRRQRFEQNAGSMRIVNLMECDLRRTILINDRARKYMITPFGKTDSSTAADSSVDSSASQQTRRGGIVTYIMTATDTGERKQMFGLTARHIKTATSVEPSPEACDQSKSRSESDGWYVDLQLPDCNQEAYASANRRANRSQCEDEIRYKQTGTAKLGYPLLLTQKQYNPDGSVSSTTTTTEVVELSRAPLDAALFDVPAGYSEAKNAQELYNFSAMAGNMMGSSSDSSESSSGAGGSSSMATTAKRAGVIRIGVMAINNKTDRSVATDSLRDRLVSSINGSNVEAVTLSADSLADVDAEAKQKDCDFILSTDINSLKQSSTTRKVGGLLGRAAGVGSGGIDKSESHVDFKLTAVGSASPQLESSATAKEEGDEQSVGAALEREAKMVVAAARKRK
jgi:hypothetical protein